MKALVETIVKVLVDRPDDVKVTVIKGSHVDLIRVEVAKEDRGKVIGRRGVHADAIRTILAAVGGKAERRYVLELIED